MQVVNSNSYTSGRKKRVKYSCSVDFKHIPTHPTPEIIAQLSETVGTDTIIQMQARVETLRLLFQKQAVWAR